MYFQDLELYKFGTDLKHVISVYLDLELYKFGTDLTHVISVFKLGIAEDMNLFCKKLKNVLV